MTKEQFEEAVSRSVIQGLAKVIEDFYKEYPEELSYFCNTPKRLNAFNKILSKAMILGIDIACDLHLRHKDEFDESVKGSS